jgi:RNA polymerase sigma factor (sigma-70 family)
MAIDTLGGALRQINRLFAEGSVTGLTDAHLLERFFADHDAAAFEVLVARHGPMVLSVCRGVLRDPNDAEDAFQATFLVLVKKGGSIRGRDGLGGWLYQVAHRVALRANAAAARRLTHERQAGQMAAATVVPEPRVSDELLRAVHEEIAWLPEKLRPAIVLCDLQGVPHVRAAAELRLSERTLRRRLSEARQQLKNRLGSRGLAPDGEMMAAIFLREAGFAVPAAWLEATVQAAQAMTIPIAAGAVSAAAAKLSHEVLAIILLQKLKLVSAALVACGLMAWGASVTLMTRGNGPPQAASTPVAVVPRTASASTTKPVAEPDPLDAVGKFPVRGQVLDPDGKPVANAEISIRHRTEFGSTPISPVVTGQQGRVAVSDAHGRFQFELDKASSNWPYGDLPPWRKALIAATAPGFGLAWAEAGSLANGEEANLRLVRDDVPIRGRVLDTEGRPVAGVTVRLGRVRAVTDGVDLDAMLASGTVDEAQISASHGYNEAVWPGGRNIWISDADGRFEVKGVGRDRLGLLFFHGPGLADASLYVMARAATMSPRSRPGATETSDFPMVKASAFPLRQRLVGATFEHVAGPTKPIHGVVRFKRSGKPASGVMIHGYESATRIAVSAQADAEGRFRLVGLPKGGSYRIYAWARTGIDPFFGVRISVTDTAGLKPIETALELPKGVIVIGRLVDDATGRSVPAGQSLFVKLPANPNEEGDREVMKLARLSLTDPTFRITVPPGEVMLYAAPRGWETSYARARLSEVDQSRGLGGIADKIPLQFYNTYKIVDVPDTAEPFKVELKLTRGKSRGGKVVGPDGQPVTGAYCYGLLATGGGEETVKKLTADTFEVVGLEPGQPRQLIFSHQGRRLVGSVIITGEDVRNDAPIEVRLERAGTVKGRLIDEDGSPLSGVKLSIVSFGIDVGGLPSENLWPDGSTFTTDADGRFQVTGLKPGTKSNIGIHMKTRPNDRLDTGGVLFNIKLQQPGEVRDLGDVKVKEVPQ